MSKDDLKHSGKMPDAREKLNRSVREGRRESSHCNNSLGGMGSCSHDIGAEFNAIDHSIRMHHFRTVNRFADSVFQ